MKKSEQINELSAALSAFQGEIKDAVKSNEGYGYNYANLSDILIIARPLLAKNGLALIQLAANAPEIEGHNGTKIQQVAVETILTHKSGQWISEVYAMPVERKISNKGKETLSLAQCVGVTITYCRRYAASAILGMTQTDNDASVVDFVTGAELKKLKDMIAKTNSDIALVCRHCGIDEIEDISHENYLRVMDMLSRKAAVKTDAQAATETKTESLKELGRKAKESKQE